MIKQTNSDIVVLKFVCCQNSLIHKENTTMIICEYLDIRVWACAEQGMPPNRAAQSQFLNQSSRSAYMHTHMQRYACIYAYINRTPRHGLTTFTYATYIVLNFILQTRKIFFFNLNSNN